MADTPQDAEYTVRTAIPRTGLPMVTDARETHQEHDDEPLLAAALRIAQLYADNTQHSMLTIESEVMAEFLRWASDLREDRDTAVGLLRLLRDADGPSAEGAAWGEVRSFFGQLDPPKEAES